MRLTTRTSYEEKDEDKAQDEDDPDQQVLALLALAGALVTDDAGLAVIAGPAVLLEVGHQLGGVHPARRNTTHPY